MNFELYFIGVISVAVYYVLRIKNFDQLVYKELNSKYNVWTEKIQKGYNKIK